MTRTCICCNHRMSKDVLLSDVSLFGFPKSDDLLKRWSLAIGTEKKITGSSQICSRHFKENDFKYSLVGSKRYLKHDAIPSLYLNEENTVSNNQSAIIKENQSTNTVVESSERAPENEALNVIESRIEVKRDDKLSENISLAQAGPSDPEKKRKKYLYDVRWEEISTSSVQAKIYWEVAIKKIMRQKVLLRTLRQKLRRLKKQILDFQTLG
ncbi:PREDICTED: THAP domain-containing protein 3-like isoform X2 [Vollenhovia emeryi]|uniref:THAP domain-containing protein 3-like isoform X2 n=1 Tax=Vollenhovia emeryi TaxID=411798 RepID=UPI0005F434B1|nr:PREDICTED: THAP domain-containing protein 3-like isoform X2 [Vollenhovia emeryi]